MTQYAKEDDYTLRASWNPPGSKGTLSRYFNFASEQVVTIFTERAEMEKSIKAGAYDGGAGISVAVALSSQMQIQRFSDMDSQTEIEMMREKLVSLGGKPPAATATPGKTARLG